MGRKNKEPTVRRRSPKQERQLKKLKKSQNTRNPVISERDFVAEQIALRFNRSKPKPKPKPQPIAETDSEDNTDDAGNGSFEEGSDFISVDADASTSLKTVEQGWENALESPEPEGKDEAQANERNRSTPWMEDIDPSSFEDSVQMLNAELAAFNTFVSATPSEMAVRRWVYLLIERALQLIWPQARVSLVGSTATGLLLPEGDLDLVAYNEDWPKPPEKMFEDDLKLIARQMKHTHIAAQGTMEIVAKARIPVIKFISRFGGFNVDIAFNTSSDVSAAETIKRVNLYRYCTNENTSTTNGIGVESKIQPQRDLGVARTLILVLKMLFQQRGLNEVYTGGLGGYAIVLMVCAFLEAHPLVQHQAINPLQNVGVLLLEFLFFFGRQLNYDKVALTLVDKDRVFLDKSELSRSLPDLSFRPFSLTVLDPIDPTHDVTSGTFNLRGVIRAFQGAFEALSTVICARDEDRVSDLANIPNYDRSLAGHHDVKKRSILGTVIGVPQTTLQSRLEMKSLVQSGEIQKVLLASGVAPGPEHIPLVDTESENLERYDTYLETFEGHQPISASPEEKAVNKKRKNSSQAFWASKG